MKPKERPETALDAMLKQQLELLYNMQDFKETTEYKAINMSMVTICKELNTLRIKEITNEQGETETR